MKKAILSLLVVSVLLVSIGLAFADKPANVGFDEFGYNYQANIFSGTCHSWYIGKFGGTDQQASDYCGIYDNDRLVMKWSRAWDDAIFGPNGIREDGDESDWATDAWENKNGMVLSVLF